MSTIPEVHSIPLEGLPSHQRPASPPRADSYATSATKPPMPNQTEVLSHLPELPESTVRPIELFAMMEIYLCSIIL